MTARRDGLLKHSLILMAAQQVGNVTTVGFQMLTGRMLSKPEYAIMIPLLGIIVSVIMPMDSVRTAFAHFSARLDHDGQRGQVWNLLRQWMRYLLWAGLLILIGGYFASWYIADLLHFESRLPVLVTMVVLAGSIFLPVIVGSLQGVQAFWWFTTTSQVWGLVRFLAAAVLLFWVSKSAVSGLAAQLCGVLFSLGLGWYGLRQALGDKPDRAPPVKGVRRYTLKAVFVLAGYAVLMNFDVVLARIYFPEVTDYARASTVGRSIIFFAQPVAMAMFPKVATAGEATAETWQTMKKAILYSVLLIFPFLLLVFLFPQYPIWLLYGRDAIDETLIQYVRGVLVAMSPLALAFLLMNYELAQHRFKAAYGMLVCALLFVASVYFYHPSLWHIIGMLGAYSLLATVVLACGLPWRNGKTTD